MEIYNSINLILLSLSFFFFGIDDIKRGKISNKLVFLSLTCKIILDLAFMKFLVISTKYFVIYVMIFSILIMARYRNYIGGGDFKALGLVLIFLSPDSSFSILKVQTPDIIEFFLFTTIISLILKFAYKKQIDVKMAPVFFFSIILVFIF
jgi:Flp pilus assembly protein protease CpaA